MRWHEVQPVEWKNRAGMSRARARHYEFSYGLALFRKDMEAAEDFYDLRVMALQDVELCMARAEGGLA